MSWQEECIYVKWQGAPPLAGQEFFPQNQHLKLTDSREDAQKRDVPEHVPMARVNSWELKPAGNQNQRSIKV